MTYAPMQKDKAVEFAGHISTALDALLDSDLRGACAALEAAAKDVDQNAPIYFHIWAITLKSDIMRIIQDPERAVAMGLSLENSELRLRNIQQQLWRA